MSDEVAQQRTIAQSSILGVKLFSASSNQQNFRKGIWTAANNISSQFLSYCLRKGVGDINNHHSSSSPRANQNLSRSLSPCVSLPQAAASRGAALPSPSARLTQTPAGPASSHHRARRTLPIPFRIRARPWHSSALSDGDQPRDILLLLLYPFFIRLWLGVLPLGSSPAEIDHGSSHPGPPPPLLLPAARWILPQSIGIEANTERWTEEKSFGCLLGQAHVDQRMDAPRKKGLTYQPTDHRSPVY
jgi:hypothetical protein